MAQNIGQTTLLSTSSSKFAHSVKRFKESTSPRKRKNFLEKLKSNLSPKYIGEIKIEDLENSESQRNLRRRNLNGHSIKSSAEENAVKETMTTPPPPLVSNLAFAIDEEVLAPNRIDYNALRRTDKSAEKVISTNKIISTAHVAHKHACRKVYISPIDKLLISNGSTAPLINDEANPLDVSWFDAELKNSDKSDCDSSPRSSKPKKEDSGNCEKSDDSENNAAILHSSMKIECYESGEEHSENINRASPSILSLDSAQGSSVVNSECIVGPPFAAGDICWGQIFTYCYWPCIVCADPEGKTITTVGARNRERHVVVHVRFFADQGRRNWVKRENLMTYHGLDAYKDWMREKRAQLGSKHSKSKFLMPTQAKLLSWKQAIGEADKVLHAPSEERLRIFHDIQRETTKLLKKQKIQNAKQLTVRVYSVDNDIQRDMQAKDEKNGFMAQHEYTIEESEKNLITGIKRERSESPVCPPYSPIKPAPKKQRQTSYGDTENKSSFPINTIDITNNVVDNNVANNEFRKFYAVMRNFVMANNTDEQLEKSLAVAVSNIWALKQINQTHQKQHLLDSLDETPKLGSDTTSVKRLSNRLKYLPLPHTLNKTTKTNMITTKTSTPNTTNDNAISLEANDTGEQIIKVKKPLNRPIEEVVDDILHLDNKYLFKGMSREPVCKYCYKPGGHMVRCAKLNCQTYFHAICLSNPPATPVIYIDQKELQIVKTSKRASRKNIAALPLPQINIDNNNFEIKHQTADSVIDEKIEADKETLSYSELLNILCKDCEHNEPSKCCVCQNVQKFNDEGEEQELLKCNLPQCNGYYHEICCKYWPQAKFVKSKNLMEYFRCPSHVCHTCVSDDPKGKFQHLSNSKLTRCIKCPASYHTDSTCIPAGSIILTAAHIICPRHHAATKSDQHVNVSWCFICVGGGHVLCCETCPTAVHADCMKINTPTGAYICEECESGRMPLYGELVWAKFNSFRWWPAIILPPTEVPSNILRRAHNAHEFVVRFFGTHDHGWISRRRVYLFVEGDCGEPPRSKNSNLDKNYVRGVIEAKRIYELMQQRKQVLRLQLGDAMEKAKSLQPQPFIKIKNNKPVAPLKLRPLDIEHVNKCECDPNDVEPCGPDSNCLNRVLYHECNPKVCAAGARCLNQLFESRISPRLEVAYMKERGFGLKCREPIGAGTFIIEYVGELINDTEFNERLAQKFRDRDENFYFLSLEKDHIIDAGPKGNLARFMNHSCNPNCETQKWTVNCNNRVGIFAIKDIPANTELTFNYLWDDLMGNEKKPCYCGAFGCTGQIGAKSKDDKAKIGFDANKLNRKRRKQQQKFFKINPKPLTTTITTTTTTTTSSSDKKKINQNTKNEKPMDTKILNNLLQ